MNQDNNIILKRYNNKQVSLISYFVVIKSVENVKCWDRKSKTHIVVPSTAIVETYNKFMEGVDLHDMLSALYKFSFRLSWWHMYIWWWHTVTVAVTNVWNVYRKYQKKLEPLEKPMVLCNVFRFWLLLLPQEQERPSIADHYPALRRLQHHPVKAQAAV